VICRRASCAQSVTRCPNRERTGSCWYYRCLGWIHGADGMHACADFGGEAQPEPGTLPLTEAPASKPDGAVAQ